MLKLFLLCVVCWWGFVLFLCILILFVFFYWVVGWLCEVVLFSDFVKWSGFRKFRCFFGCDWLSVVSIIDCCLFCFIDGFVCCDNLGLVRYWGFFLMWILFDLFLWSGWYVCWEFNFWVGLCCDFRKLM